MTDQHASDLAGQAARQEASASRGPTKGGNLQRVRVLVVDDETLAAEGVQDILELEGHVVGIAHDKASAVQAAKMMAPDLALVDLRFER